MMLGKKMREDDGDIVDIYIYIYIYYIYINREKKQIQTLTCCYNTLYQNPAEHAARNSSFFVFFRSSFLLINSKIRYESTHNVVRTPRAYPERERYVVVVREER